MSFVIFVETKTMYSSDIYLLVGFFVGSGVVGLFVGDSDGGAVVGGKVA